MAAKRLSWIENHDVKKQEQIMASCKHTREKYKSLKFSFQQKLAYKHNKS